MKHIYLFILCCILSSCEAQLDQKKEFKGISFEAPNTIINYKTLQPIQETNANWISIMPYGYTKDNNPQIYFNEQWQWNGERTEGILQTIKAARTNNLQIMMKPHLWIKGKFTGNVQFKTDQEWRVFETSYQDYILYYAQLAEQHHIELFCIGTELKQFVIHRPDYWNNLITKVKSVYSGSITYAANWDNYNNIPFWRQIDYIGIDAYFPLSDKKSPQLPELIQSWEKWWKEINTVVQKNQKNVIFTEVGYRSIDYCAQKPWNSYEDLGDENQEAQYNCLKAFFDTSKQYDFYKGAFIWKFHSKQHLPSNGNKKYTYQSKLSEQLIIEHFSK